MIKEQMIEIVKSGLSWTAQQAPEIMGQLILWRTCDYILGIIFSLIILIIVYRIFLNTEHKIESDEFADWGDYIVTAVILAMVGLFFVIVLICNIYFLLQISIAPKVWLIEYISDAMRCIN